MTGILTLLFLGLMFLGMPVAFAIGVAFIMFYLFGPVPAMISVQKVVGATQSFPLLAVPLFIFAGHLMNHLRHHRAADPAVDRVDRLDLRRPSPTWRSCCRR